VTFKANGTTVNSTGRKVSLFAFGPEYTGYFGENYYISISPSLTVVAHLSTSFNKDSGSNAPTWSSRSATIAFSATYN